VRPISDSGYRHPSGWGGGGGGNPLYRGELTEFDVLGIDRQQSVSEADVRAAAAARQPLSLRKGAALLLIQSGALLPDATMIRALESHYTVGVFSGIPDAAPAGASPAAPTASAYAMKLRLAAARGGYDTIVTYWGLLEAEQQRLATKAVSWVPIVGMAIPDETQRLRIRLKVAVVDVASGRWDVFAPAEFDDDALSASLIRASSDQTQVALLKDRAYKAAAEDLVKRYAR
jgi:hypothetical protein